MDKAPKVHLLQQNDIDNNIKHIIASIHQDIELRKEHDEHLLDLHTTSYLEENFNRSLGTSGCYFLKLCSSRRWKNLSKILNTEKKEDKYEMLYAIACSISTVACFIFGILTIAYASLSKILLTGALTLLTIGSGILAGILLHRERKKYHSINNLYQQRLGEFINAQHECQEFIKVAAVEWHKKCLKSSKPQDVKTEIDKILEHRKMGFHTPDYSPLYERAEELQKELQPN